jgi:hypothetical protein
MLSSRLVFGRCWIRIPTSTPIIVFSRGFPQFLQGNAGIVPWSGDDHFIHFFLVCHSFINHLIRRYLVWILTGSYSKPQKKIEGRTCTEGVWKQGAQKNGLKGEEVTGGWIKLHDEKLHNLHPSPDVISVIKSGMRWAGHVARTRDVQFWLENSKDHVGVFLRSFVDTVSIEYTQRWMMIGC